MSNWKQIGTVEILRFRIYPIDPMNDGPLATTVGVQPGVYPVYRKFDAIRWVMDGRINERNAKIGDGLYELYNGDADTGLDVRFSSRAFGVEEFRELLEDPEVATRLRFDVEVSA